MENQYFEKIKTFEKIVNFSILIVGLIIYILLLMVVQEPLMFDFGSYLKQVIDMKEFSNWTDQTIAQSIYHSFVYILMEGFGFNPITSINLMIVFSIIIVSISIFLLLLNRTNNFIASVYGTVFFFFNPLSIVLFTSLYKQMIEVVCIVLMLLVVNKFHDSIVSQGKRSNYFFYGFYFLSIFLISVTSYLTSVLVLLYLLFFQITSIFLLLFSNSENREKNRKATIFYILSNVAVILAVPISNYIAINSFKFGGSVLDLTIFYILKSDNFVSNLFKTQQLMNDRSNLFVISDLLIVFYLIISCIIPLILKILHNSQVVKITHDRFRELSSGNLLLSLSILSYLSFIFVSVLYPEEIVSYDAFSSLLFPVWIVWLPFIGSLIAFSLLKKEGTSEKMRSFIIINGVIISSSFFFLTILVLSGFQQASGFPLRRVEIFLTLPFAFLAGIAWEDLMKKNTNFSFIQIIFLSPLLFILLLLFINPLTLQSIIDFNIESLYYNLLSLELLEEFFLCIILILGGILSIRNMKFFNEINTLHFKSFLPPIRNTCLIFILIISNIFFIYLTPPLCTSEEVEAIQWIVTNIDDNSTLVVPQTLSKWPTYYYINYPDPKSVNVIWFDTRTETRTFKSNLEHFLTDPTVETYSNLIKTNSEAIWIFFSDYSRSVKYLEAAGINHNEIIDFAKSHRKEYHITIVKPTNNTIVLIL